MEVLILTTFISQNAKKFWAFTCCDYFNKVRDEVETFLVENSVEDYFFIVTGITEAVNNSLIHGQCTDEAVKLSIRINENKKIVVRIRHNGIGFNGNEYVKQIKGKEHDLLVENIFNENGRGILMMCVIFTNVIYNEIGNEILLVKDLSKVIKCN